MGYWHDNDGHSFESRSVSWGNGKLGVAFDFQDKARIQRDGVPIATYIGWGFAASVTYDSKFVNYNGNARTVYAHTWDTTSINSISFSGGAANYGASVSFDKSSNRWPAYNDRDTVF